MFSSSFSFSLPIFFLCFWLFQLFSCWAVLDGSSMTFPQKYPTKYWTKINNVNIIPNVNNQYKKKTKADILISNNAPRFPYKKILFLFFFQTLRPKLRLIRLKLSTVTNLQGEKPIFKLHFLCQKVGSNCCLVLITKLLIYIPIRNMSRQTTQQLIEEPVSSI